MGFFLHGALVTVQGAAADGALHMGSPALLSRIEAGWWDARAQT